MDAIETLMGEHRVIEGGIDALVAFADEVLRGSDDRAELARFVTFIREFADAHHHGKEEDILFKVMVEAGFPERGGPIGVMLMEHDMGRARVKVLADHAAGSGSWTPEERGRIAEAAHGYAQLLREHIHKEDAILYPMAEQRLPPHLLDRVNEECQAFEAHEAGKGVPDRLRALAGELAARHAAGPPEAESR
jgi:hemerythrin-like domain-containing protein